MIGSERVQQILEQTHNFATINSPSNTEAINKLISLRDFLQSQEQIFYDSIGVHNIQGLNKLLSKIDSIKNLSALDAGGIVYNYINEHYTFQGQKNNEFNSYVGENIFDLFTELLSETSAQTFLERYLNDSQSFNPIYDALMDAITEAFKDSRLKDESLEIIFTARGSRSSTGRYKKEQKGLIGKGTIKINLNDAIKNNQIQIVNDRFVVEGTPAYLSSTVQKEIKERIRPKLMQRLNKQYTGKIPLEQLSTEELRKLVNNVIISYGRIQLDSLDLEAVQKIAINASAGGISGYLGELQSRLYFRQLLSEVKDAKIIEAGADYIKSMSGSTQMDPADTIIKVSNQIFNIQVKNYAKGGADWSGSTKKILTTGEEIRDTSTAEGFVKERLQLNLPFLLEFFGAATWHNLNSMYEKEPFYEDYKRLYGEFQKIFEELKRSFDTFIPNIIRLTAIVNDLEELQYENFYFQKGKMIPSSAIVDGIIEALQNAPSKKIYTSSYEMYPGKSHYTHEKPYIDYYAPFAKETAIQWKVSVNFNSVLARLGLS